MLFYQWWGFILEKGLEIILNEGFIMDMLFLFYVHHIIINNAFLETSSDFKS